jgi:hypothetical protein
LKPYSSSPEPKRFTTYYEQMASGAATILARAER